MTDAVLSQIEQILQGIETRTEHLEWCRVFRAYPPSIGAAWVCDCDSAARVRTEIARTVERMGAYLIHEGREGNSDKAWAASLQAARPEETKP